MKRFAMIFASVAALGAGAGLVPTAILLPSAWAHEGMDEDNDSAGEPGDPKLPARTVEVTMAEDNGTMSYSPAEIDVKKGEQIRFVIKNAGILKHEFFLDSAAHNAQHKMAMQNNPEMTHHDPNAQSIEPGEQANLFWLFTKAGTFEFACLIPGHYEAGMHGKIVVK